MGFKKGLLAMKLSKTFMSFFFLFFVLCLSAAEPSGEGSTVMLKAFMIDTCKQDVVGRLLLAYPIVAGVLGTLMAFLFMYYTYHIVVDSLEGKRERDRFRRDFNG